MRLDEPCYTWHVTDAIDTKLELACWQSFFESGMLSSVLFLVAMFMYDAAWFLDAKSLATAAVFVVASALFVADALADIVWSLHARAVDARDPLVDKIVELELLGAVLFLIPSLFALLSSIADERIANFGGDALQNVCLWVSPVLYFVDSLVVLAGRWRELARRPKTLRAPLLFLDTSQSCLFCVDWLTWGAALFCAGALLDIGDQAWPDNPWGLNFAVSDVLWTLDALIYMLVAQGAWRVFLRNVEKYLQTLEAYKAKDGTKARSPIWNFQSQYRTAALIQELEELTQQLKKEEEEAVAEGGGDQEEDSAAASSSPRKRARSGDA
ncbi:unnamed protein product [Polarella glacialis]|uniref:Transmembrane protein n=1 Tax=Polarella glacialis TaxID=89957 RepID=A0A813JTB2_POLGL|nr:unnamed protein product [Polarella glacialis]